MQVASETQRQWFMRPEDEKFAEVEDLYMYVQNRKQNTRTRPVKMLDMEFQPSGKNLLLYENNRLDNPLVPTNWAFAQTCAMVGAHASYLSELPAHLAADCLNFGLKK